MKQEEEIERLKKQLKKWKSRAKAWKHLYEFLFELNQYPLEK